MPQDPYEAPRTAMIEQQLRRRGIVMHAVLEAMQSIPRHLFVSPQHASAAYADEALPSLEGQTISQPYMVARMTQELAVRPGHRVLEIGTGTGYQTAVLAHLVKPEGIVCTIERVAALSDAAHRRLDALGFANVHFAVGDGTKGWPADAPWNGPRGKEGVPIFDRILVTAGTPPEVPAPLLAQLAPDGIMVVPVGDAEEQTLWRVTRQRDTWNEEKLLQCRFVPLIGEYGWGDPQESRHP